MDKSKTRNTRMLMRRCRRCNELFERNSKWNFICEMCVRKGRIKGHKKRMKTLEGKKLNEKIKKLKEMNANRKKWKIVEEDGTVLKKGIYSKQVAKGILKEVRLSSKENLQLISY